METKKNVEPKDSLVLLKERYEAEKKTGDLSEAARNAKLSPPNASTALAKSKWNDLTKSERRTMICLKKILDLRKQEEEAIMDNV